MVNELVQWLVLIATVFLVLGLYRQLAHFIGEPGLPDLAEQTGPAVGDSIEPFAWDRLCETDPAVAVRQTSTVAFVTERCVACQRLLAGIDEGSREGLVLVAFEPSEAFRSALERTGVPCLFDTGAVWEAANVQITPLVIAVTAEGITTRKEVTHELPNSSSSQASSGRR